MPPISTVQQLLLLASTKKINSLDAELIIAHVLNKPREFVIAYPEYEIDSYKVHKVIKFLKLRGEGVPLAYLTGHKQFFGLDFETNKHTLIPRPETELIVSLALDKIKRLQDKKIILVDVGTGSGCIPISIIRNLEIKKLRNLKTFAIDISPKALIIAKSNARKNKVKIKFLHGNLLTKFPIKSKLSNSQTIITANLPYLTPQQFKSESSIQHEPKSALVAGPDGLKYYKELLEQISKNLFLIPYSLFLEIDPSQSSPIKLLIKKFLPQAKITLYKDLAGKNRMVEINV